MLQSMGIGLTSFRFRVGLLLLYHTDGLSSLWDIVRPNDSNED